MGSCSSVSKSNAGAGGSRTSVKGLSENTEYNLQYENKEFQQAVGKRISHQIENAKDTKQVFRVLQKAGFKLDDNPVRKIATSGLMKTAANFSKETNGIMHQIYVRTEQGYRDNEFLFYSDINYAFHKYP